MTEFLPSNNNNNNNKKRIPKIVDEDEIIKAEALKLLRKYENKDKENSEENNNVNKLTTDFRDFNFGPGQSQESAYFQSQETNIMYDNEERNAAYGLNKSDLNAVENLQLNAEKSLPELYNYLVEVIEEYEKEEEEKQKKAEEEKLAKKTAKKKEKNTSTTEAKCTRQNCDTNAYELICAYVIHCHVEDIKVETYDDLLEFANSETVDKVKEIFPHDQIEGYIVDLERKLKNGKKADINRHQNNTNEYIKRIKKALIEDPNFKSAKITNIKIAGKGLDKNSKADVYLKLNGEEIGISVKSVKEDNITNRSIYDSIAEVEADTKDKKSDEFKYQLKKTVSEFKTILGRIMEGVYKENEALYKSIIPPENSISLDKYCSMLPSDDDEKKIFRACVNQKLGGDPSNDYYKKIHEKLEFKDPYYANDNDNKIWENLLRLIYGLDEHSENDINKKIPLYVCDGTNFKLLNRLVISEELKPEGEPTLIDVTRRFGSGKKGTRTANKMWFKLHVANIKGVDEYFKVEIRFKGSFSASPQFTTYYWTDKDEEDFSEIIKLSKKENNNATKENVNATGGKKIKKTRKQNKKMNKKNSKKNRNKKGKHTKKGRRKTTRKL